MSLVSIFIIYTELEVSVHSDNSCGNNFPIYFVVKLLTSVADLKAALEETIKLWNEISVAVRDRQVGGSHYNFSTKIKSSINLLDQEFF